MLKGKKTSKGWSFFMKFSEVTRGFDRLKKRGKDR